MDENCSAGKPDENCSAGKPIFRMSCLFKQTSGGTWKEDVEEHGPWCVVKYCGTALVFSEISTT